MGKSCSFSLRLNAVTKKDQPRIDDILDMFGKNCTLDLASGHWQIKTSDDAPLKSAFATPRGLHEFVRMPFGLYKAPATFQRLMEVVLAGMIWQCWFMYIDDVIVSSLTLVLKEHIDHLNEVSQTSYIIFAKKKTKKLHVRAARSAISWSSCFPTCCYSRSQESEKLPCVPANLVLRAYSPEDQIR